MLRLPEDKNVCCAPSRCVQTACWRPDKLSGLFPAQASPFCLHFWARKTVKSLKLSSKMRLSCFSLRITICLPFEVPLPHVAGLRYHKIAFEMPPGAAPKMPFCCFLRRPRSARVHVVGHRLLHGLNITFGGSQVSNLRGSWGPFGGPSGAKMGEDL